MIKTAIKKTISLPADLARETEGRARAEGKSVSAVIQEALRLARIERLKREFHDIQGYWTQLAKEQGLLSEKDLDRFLKA